MQIFPFLGWWKSLAASGTGPMTGKELISSRPGPGAVRRRVTLAGQPRNRGLGVEVTARALGSDLLRVLCGVCGLIP